MLFSNILMLIFNSVLLFYSNKTEEIYLFFDPNSTSTCQVSSEMEGRFHVTENIKSYEKIESSTGNVRFYICKELFQYTSSNLIKIDKLSKSEFCKLKFSNLDDLIKKVKKENTLYPSEVFPIIYIIEEDIDKSYRKYPVEWKYYIE